MIGEKGQEAAPFELLIAVIIMGFVIFVGLRAMSVLNEQKCFNEINADLEDMKTRLETVVTERSPQQINFNLSTCYNPLDETIRIKDFSEPALCAQYCGATKNLCTVLQYYNQGSTSFSIRKCINISPDTIFPYTGASCPEKEGFHLVDFREGMEQGYYLIVNKTGATDTFPTVCAYLRET